MFLQQSAPTAALRTRLFVLRASDGVTPYTSALAGADVQLSKAGAALANAAGAATHLASGLYALVLATGDLDTLGELVLAVVKTGVQSMILSLGQVISEDPYAPSYYSAVVAGTLTTTVFTCDRQEADANHWAGALWEWVSGANKGSVKPISASSFAGGKTTVTTTAFTTAPTAGDVGRLITK